MFFKQFFLESLGHASYPVGSEQTGEALALDPRVMVEVPGRPELAPIAEEATRRLGAPAGTGG